MKKAVIPFGVLSTVTLLTGFKVVKAETTNGWQTLRERGDVRKDIFSKEAIEERGGQFAEFKEFHSNFNEMFEMFKSALDWLNHFPEHVANFSVNLLSYIFEILSQTVLYTPLFIFNNPYIKNTSLTLGIISVSIVTILTIFEAIMQMCKKDHTKISKIIKRYPIAVGVTGFAPFLFESGFKLLNKLSKLISGTSGSLMNGVDIKTDSISNYANAINLDGMDNWLSVCTLLGFDVLAIALLFPVVLHNCRRWFDLLSLSVISPLAMTAYIFDRHRHLHLKWWNQIKKLSLVQIVYSFFLLLMGVLILATTNLHGIWNLAPRLMLLVGGLYRLTSPPQFVMQYADNGKDIFGMYDDLKKGFTNVKDTLTLKNFRPANFVKGKLLQKKLKAQHILMLKKKHGRRNVDDLL